MFTVNDALNFKVTPQNGTYSPKPEGAKTVTQWLKAGKVPFEKEDIKWYAMSDTQGYAYVSPDRVRDLTPEEAQIPEVKSILDAEKERLKIKAEKDALKEQKAAERSALAEERKALKAEREKEKARICEERAKKRELKTKEKELKREQNKEIKSEKEKLEAPLPAYIQRTNFDLSGKRVLCFDTETTGIDCYKGEELLSLSIVDRDTKEVLLDTYVKPHYKESWVGAMMVNHISPRMVKNAPYPEEVRQKVQEIINSADVLVAYNAPFDVKFLNYCMKIDFSGKEVLDPCKIFKDEYPEGKHKLLDALHMFAPEAIPAYERAAHTAVADTVALAYLTDGMERELGKEKEEERQNGAFEEEKIELE